VTGLTLTILYDIDEVVLMTHNFGPVTRGVFRFISRDESISFGSKVYETKITSLFTMGPIIFFIWQSLIPYLGGALVIVTDCRLIDSTRLFCRFGKILVLANVEHERELFPVHYHTEFVARIQYIIYLCIVEIHLSTTFRDSFSKTLWRFFYNNLKKQRAS